MSAVEMERASPTAFGEAVLEVKGLRIAREREGSSQTITSSISLSVARGETVGIVGESGSGKSMTARAIVGLLPPTLVASGEVLYGGSNLLAQKERKWRDVRGREIALIMQDPFTMLNPVISCGRILGESLLRGPGVGRFSRGWRRAEAIRRLAEVGITDEAVADRFPFQLSGGMRQRVAIAAALAREPKILIADEPSTALDVTTQREILALMKALQKSHQMSLVLITHDLRVAFAMCDRIYVLYAGSLLEVGPSRELDHEPLHPYTQGLLLSEPSTDRHAAELVAIPGAVPSPDDVASCCTFAPRCQWVSPVCQEGAPALREIAAGRHSACVRIEAIRGEMAAARRGVDAGEDLAQPVAQAVFQDSDADGALIRVRDMSKVFKNGKKEVHALEAVSVHIGEGDSVGIVGESGSGKTTLARILVGLERPTGGDIVIDGVPMADWTRLTRQERRRLRSAVQIVFQDPYSSLNPMRSVGAALREVVTTHHPSARNVKERVDDLLTSVGLPTSYAQRKPVALSGGERQRVAIARALAVSPRILICDEPVSALDVSVQAQILNLLMKLRSDRGLGYLFITHDLSIVRHVTDRLYVMYQGRVVEAGSVDAILDNPTDPYTVKLLESAPRSDVDWLTVAG